MEMNRRSLITGLISLVAAPAIVRAGSLMPVKVTLPQAVSGSRTISTPWNFATPEEIYSDIARMVRMMLDDPSSMSRISDSLPFAKRL